MENQLVKREVGKKIGQNERSKDVPGHTWRAFLIV